jgi:hypothetical protein
VSLRQLRALFNAVILPKILAKEVLETVKSEGTPNPKHGEPAGSLSQIVAYSPVEGGKIGRPIALAHRYLRPDGTLGASGLPDPKWIFDDGKIYKAKTNAEWKRK